MTRYWAFAPKQKRKKRVQKKIDQRNGAKHYLPRWCLAKEYAWLTCAPARATPWVLSKRKNPMRAPSRFAAYLFVEAPGANVLAKTMVGDVEVSTVFLWVVLWDETPQFETMTFRDGDESGIQIRYETRDEALEGHRQIVEELIYGITAYDDSD